MCGTVTSRCRVHHLRQFRDSIMSDSLYKVLVSLHLFFSSSSSQHTYLQRYSSFLQHQYAMSTSIKITPSMVMSSVYMWLEKYANKEATVSHVLHNIEFELGAMKASFHEDSWMDILDHIVIRPNGWCYGCPALFFLHSPFWTSPLSEQPHRCTTHVFLLSVLAVPTCTFLCSAVPVNSQ